MRIRQIILIPLILLMYLTTWCQTPYSGISRAKTPKPTLTPQQQLLQLTREMAIIIQLEEITPTSPKVINTIKKLASNPKKWILFNREKLLYYIEKIKSEFNSNSTNYQNVRLYNAKCISTIATLMNTNISTKRKKQLELDEKTYQRREKLLSKISKKN